MKVNILINLLDKHNESSLLATDKLRPNKVIYIKDKETDEIYKDIEVYHKNAFPNIEIEDILINEDNIDNINEILNKVSVEDTVINVTGGKRVQALILLNQSLIRGFNSIYIDVLNKHWYSFGKEITKIQNKFNDMYLEDMLKTSGADIVIDSTKLSEKEDVIKLTKKIYDNLNIWYRYKQKLHDTNIFIHDYVNNRKININLDYFDKEELDIINKSLEYLKSLNGIEYKRINNEIEVNFFNDYLKGFIFKSGTWLEVLTNIIVKEIIEVDEVKSGVVFLWNQGEQRIRNELDVLAVKDSVLICISCKDSEKYDEDALNELDVYSKRLGGSNAKKILVATKYPCKGCVNERAKVMGINLVILDPDINIFKNTLKQIININ